MKRSNYLFLIFISVLVLNSCRKVVQLSPVPGISFTSFAIFDTTDILGNTAKGGRLKFYFEDGDGDLGLQAPTGKQADTTDLFFSLYRKKSGTMVPALPNDPLFPSPYRIPYMERLGVNKILKGTISVTFLYLFYSAGDTIKYDFYIKDRASNESNVASTGEIVISANNIYLK